MKKAVMYGAGNIGRGFIGQLFSQSGYEVVFIDINPVVIDKLNSDHRYPVKIAAHDRYEEIYVENVRGVSAADSEKVAGEIATADIMATAVGVNVLPLIAKPVANGLKKRWENGNTAPLNIIICENLIDANRYLEKLLKQELDEEQAGIFDETVGLVEASIGRMVPVMTQEMQGDNPLRVYVEEYSVLPVDRDGFKGEIPEICNMIPFSPFDFYIHRKLFMHNMAHAVTSYLGFLSGYVYVWEAIRDPSIKLITLKALQESAVALSLEYQLPVQRLLEHGDDLIYRFGNRLLGDTIERVGKDPVRKLSQKDRLIGAARNCIKNGIKPAYISIGIAAGYLFKPEKDEFAAEIQSTIANEGIDAAIARYSGITDDDPLKETVMKFYNMLRVGSGFGEVTEAAEKVKIDSFRVRI